MAVFIVSDAYPSNGDSRNQADGSTEKENTLPALKQSLHTQLVPVHPAACAAACLPPDSMAAIACSSMDGAIENLNLTTELLFEYEASQVEGVPFLEEDTVIYSVSYDLNRPGQDYEKLFDTLRSFESWCHPLDSTWFVRSSLNALEVYNKIAAAMDESDKLVVAQAGAPAAWDVTSTEVSAWLKENLKFALTFA